MTDDQSYTDSIDAMTAAMAEAAQAINEATSAITSEVAKMDEAVKWEPVAWDREASPFSLDNQITVLSADGSTLFAGTGAEFVAWRQEQQEDTDA